MPTSRSVGVSMPHPRRARQRRRRGEPDEGIAGGRRAVRPRVPVARAWHGRQDPIQDLLLVAASGTQPTD